MRDIVLFQMWGPFRESLIEEHRFYVSQAKKRLLSQFDNIEAEADKAADEWEKDHAHLFDPERHDPGDFGERAYEAGGEFYRMLDEMRTQTRLSVVAGFYHQWDKQLRDWLCREIQHWHQGSVVRGKIWKANAPDLFTLLETIGWKLKDQPFFADLEKCRLVVNAYKHGNGKALEDLKAAHPEFFDDPFRKIEIDGLIRNVEWLDWTALEVTDAHIDAFADSIEQFWKAAPERVFNSQVGDDVPDWFMKALSDGAKA